MITIDNPEVTVPPVPSPRKNKRVINGKFTIIDLIIIIPSAVLAVCIMIFVTMPIWMFAIVGISVFLVDLFLCYPMGFLGKEKVYIYIIRALKFYLGSHKKLQSESSENSFKEDK